MNNMNHMKIIIGLSFIIISVAIAYTLGIIFVLIYAVSYDSPYQTWFGTLCRGILTIIYLGSVILPFSIGYHFMVQKKENWRMRIVKLFCYSIVIIILSLGYFFIWVA